MDSFIEKERRKASASLWSWLLCIVPSLAGLALWLSLHALVKIFLALSGISTWSWDAIQTFTFLIFGLIWLASVFFIQDGLYKAAVSGTLWSRFLFIDAVLVLLLLCARALRMVLTAEPFSASTVLTIAGEAVLCATLFYFYRYTRSRRSA
ncbi:hypothetical protein ACFPYJ_05675 [Paenibacillus solisilvae]|uniref:DUF2569 domain-containing protein n=1 Tax=Paenibacillus solisilvae TaxID=2486751 RepID=A0ABW0VT43_9BACL